MASHVPAVMNAAFDTDETRLAVATCHLKWAREMRNDQRQVIRSEKANG